MQLASVTYISVFDSVTINPDHLAVKWLWANDYDNDFRINYSVGFDYGASNLGTYISQKISTSNNKFI